jgi:hypothetical protein
MWSLKSLRVRRTSGPENFQSLAKKDFFNTIGQSLHFDGRPASSDFTSTSDLSLHRANRRDVPKANVGVIIVRQLFDPGAAGQWTTIQA